MSHNFHEPRSLTELPLNRKIETRSIKDIFAQHEIDKGLKEQAAWSIAILCVAFLLINLRLWTRLVIQRKIGKDDLICVMAAMAYSLFLGSALWTRYLGTTKLEQDGAAKLLTWNTVAGSSYIWSSILIKLSIGFYLLRIISKPNLSVSSSKKKNWRRSFCVLIMLFSTGVNVLHFVYRLVFCRSTKNYYKTMSMDSLNSTSPNLVSTTPNDLMDVNMNFNITNNHSLKNINAEGFCAVQDGAHIAMVFIAATVNIVTDIAYICLPLPEMVKGLRDRRYHKLVFAVLLFAAAGIGVAVSRLPFLRGFVASNWRGGGLLSGLAMVEPGASIICACLATLRPLGERWCPCLATGKKTGKGYQEMADDPERNGSGLSNRLSSIGGGSVDEDAKEFKDIRI